MSVAGRGQWTCIIQHAIKWKLKGVEMSSVYVTVIGYLEKNSLVHCSE